jgi:hypothetical protein
MSVKTTSVQSLIERSEDSVASNDCTPESKTGKIQCSHSEPFTPSKAQYLVFQDDDSSQSDSTYDDAKFLELVKKRIGSQPFPASPNSSLSNALDVADPETVVSQLGSAYPLAAGLKWRQARGRSGASMVSSLSSMSSDGNYRSTREIQLSRKYQFSDMNEQLNSMREEFKVSGSFIEEGEIPTPSPRREDSCSDKKKTSSNKKPEPVVWSTSRTMALSGKNWSPFQKKTSSVTICPESLPHSSSERPVEVMVSSAKPKKRFSFKMLVPKFIRKRRWSLGGNAHTPNSHGEHHSATLHETQEIAAAVVKSSAFRRRASV